MRRLGHRAREPHMICRPVLFILLVYAAMALVVAPAQDTNSQNAGTAPIPTPIVYRNKHYDFCFRLPADWKGYSVIEDEWSGWSAGEGGKTFNLPELLIRHPSWTQNDPYQDIPIVIFTQAQWRDKEKYGLNMGATGVEPGPFGSNTKFVFEQLPRWVGYEQLRGMKEVQDLMATHPFQTPCPKSDAQSEDSSPEP